MRKKRVLTPEQLASRREYRRRYHEKNRERENEKNRARYHSKYKTDAAAVERRRKNWREYSLKKGADWAKARSKKYRKKYSDLTDKQKQYKRRKYNVWAKQNWAKRVAYAREYRRRNPYFGFRAAVRRATESGDCRELTKICRVAIAKING